MSHIIDLFLKRHISNYDSPLNQVFKVSVVDMTLKSSLFPGFNDWHRIGLSY